METRDVLAKLRKDNNLTQDEMAQKLFVTRQAVSRWETGETTPNIDTLKLISKEFDISINTLLGTPRQLICQCCGMPLDDNNISRENDNSFNEEYCKWCYTNGEFVYKTIDELIEFLISHMGTGEYTHEQAKNYYKDFLMKLNHWKK